MHPQPTLKRFYKWSNVILTLEALNGISWVVQMLILKFAESTGEYRLINTLMLFHFAVPVALQGVVQQTRNRNTVLWWSLFSFFIGFGSDFEAFAEILKELPRTILWSWVYILVSSVVNLVLSLTSIVLYVWYFVLFPAKDLPTDVINRFEYLHLQK